MIINLIKQIIIYIKIKIKKRFIKNIEIEKNIKNYLDLFKIIKKYIYINNHYHPNKNKLNRVIRKINETLNILIEDINQKKEKL